MFDEEYSIFDFLFEGDDDLDGLNEQQREAVIHREGPCLVLAGAGSGKTRVLIKRIVRLINSGIDPREILACTFSRKAADEMRERLVDLAGEGVAEECVVSTFHSVGFSILKDEYRHLKSFRTRPGILEGYKQQKLAKDILAATRRDGSFGMNWAKDPSSVLSVISAAKNKLFNFMEPADYFLQGDGSGNKYLSFFELYEQEKQKQNLVDFDDMLYLVWLLFDENPGILQKYQNRWKWLLVDETQDTNLAQYEIARMLAKPENNIFVVGDDCQSIYGFRGACPQVSIHGFLGMYPQGRIIKLEKNYRSGGHIIAAANLLQLENPFNKILLPTRGEGIKPVLWEIVDADEEAFQVADEVEALISEGYRYEDMAVLYRTNAQSEAIESAFIRKKIPYRIFGGMGFYQRKEIRDLIAYLQLIHNPCSEEGTEALWRVWNIASVMSSKNTHFFGQSFKTEIISISQRTGMTAFEVLHTSNFKAFQERGVRDLDRILSEANKAETLSEKIKTIRQFAYDNYLETEEGLSDAEGNPRLDNLNRLEEVAKRFDSLENFLFYVQNLSQKSQNCQENDNNSKNSVSFMSIHKSKGLEFRAVFGIGLSEGILPHSKAESEEEERRICYVLVTRAKERLYLSWIQEHNGKVMKPSVFLKEMGLVPTILEKAA